MGLSRKLTAQASRGRDKMRSIDGPVCGRNSPGIATMHANGEAEHREKADDQLAIDGLSSLYLQRTFASECFKIITDVHAFFMSDIS